MFRPLITWLDALACLATAGAVIAYYALGITAIDLNVVVIPLVQDGIFIAGAWAALEVMSFIAGQGGNNPLWWLDYFTTWVAWLFINLTGLYIWIGVVNNYPGIAERLQVPYAKDLLIGLAVFSWIAALGLQYHKHGRVWQEGQVQRQVQPPAPLPPPLPIAPVAQPQPVAHGAGTAIIIFLLAMVLLVSVFALFSAERGPIRRTAIDGDKGECTLEVESREVRNGVIYDKVIPKCP